MSAVLNFSREEAFKRQATLFPFPLSEARVAVIGLGYVGLPLATAFGSKYPTVGFDVKRDRVEQLRSGVDETGEVEAADLKRAEQLSFSNAPADIATCNVYIVAVPTPVDRNAYPDLAYLHSVFANMLADDIRIYCREFSRLLRPGGHVFATAFVEEDVPPATVNPTDYHLPSSGRLNLVRYERQHLLDLVRQPGLEVEELSHGTELGGQSRVVLRRSDR